MDVANYFAVLIAAALIIATGALWYGPLFGKQWMRLKGYTPERMKSMKMSAKKAMLFASAGALVTSFVLALIVRLINPIGIPGAFMLALLIWTGFVVPFLGNRVLFEDEDPKLYVFHIAQLFVALFLASLVLVLWP